MSASEAELIARTVIDGDHRAFGRLVQMHQSSVRRLLLRLTAGDRAMADDLAQDTFLLAYRKIAGFRATGTLAAWLYRIAYNRFLEELRKRGRAGEVELGDHLAAPVREPLARLDIEKAMVALTVPERAAITLCFSCGFSHPEAGRIMNMPLGTVKSHIARGKDKLRVALAAWEHEVAI